MTRFHGAYSCVHCLSREVQVRHQKQQGASQRVWRRCLVGVSCVNVVVLYDLHAGGVECFAYFTGTKELVIPCGNGVVVSLPDMSGSAM